MLRHQATPTLSQVGQYARRFRFSQADHDDVSVRLKQLLRLLKKHGAGSCAELLERASHAEQRLDSWFQMEGVPSALVSCCK